MAGAAGMRLAHSETSKAAGRRPGHQPKRNFSKAAGMALLPLLALSPMALPARGAAQDARPAAAVDSVKHTRIHYSFLRVNPGVGYFPSQLMEVQDVPLRIRRVEESGSVVARANASTREELLTLLDLNTGPGASFMDRHVFAEIGGGGELYLQFITTVRDTGAWYAVHAGGPLARGPLYIKPYLYSEIKIAPNGVYCDEIGFSVGYRVYYERFVAMNGVYVMQLENTGEPGVDPNYNPYAGGAYTLVREESIRNTYDLINLVTGMLYVSFVRYENENVHGSAYLGFKHVISSRATDVAGDARFVFRNPAVTFGIRVYVDLLHLP
jgi:hypothetical protein